MKKNRPVFYDLGFSPSESLALTIKAKIFSKILDVFNDQHLTQRELGKILSIPQPRVSELLNGKIASLSIEKLLLYLEKLGVMASVSFKPSKVG